MNSLDEVRKALEEKGVLKPKIKTPAEERKEKYQKFKKELKPEDLKVYNEMFDEID